MSLKIVMGETMITELGGLARKYTNKTGAPSVKGQLVAISTGTDDAVDTTGVSAINAMGVIYNSGVADGSDVWVVTDGPAEVLLKDTTAATKGYWVSTSDTAGRADATSATAPADVGGAANQGNLKRIGRCIKSVGAGSDVLAKVHLSFC